MEPLPGLLGTFAQVVPVPLAGRWAQRGRLVAGEARVTA